jgi:hypothetical protein
MVGLRLELADLAGGGSPLNSAGFLPRLGDAPMPFPERGIGLGGVVPGAADVTSPS